MNSRIVRQFGNAHNSHIVRSLATDVFGLSNVLATYRRRRQLRGVSALIIKDIDNSVFFLGDDQCRYTQYTYGTYRSDD